MSQLKIHRLLLELFRTYISGAQVLADHPEIGYRYPASSRNVRVLLYEYYRIVYLIKNDGNVDILGVFHGALDVGKYQL